MAGFLSVLLISTSAFSVHAVDTSISLDDKGGTNAVSDVISEQPTNSSSGAVTPIETESIDYDSTPETIELT